MLYKMAVAAFILLSLPILVSADIKLLYSHPFCPLVLEENPCPDATYFLYYECCGTLNTECCLKFQDWIIIAFKFYIAALVIGFALLMFVFAFPFIKKRWSQRTKQQQQSPVIQVQSQPCNISAIQVVQAPPAPPAIVQIQPAYQQPSVQVCAATPYYKPMYPALN